MSSEAITRNDLSAILNEVLPPTPSEYKKLLWTNPSPASSFSAQTISLNLSDYDCVEIETYLSPNGMTTTRLTEVGKMGEVGGLGSAGDRYARMATVSATGITFTEGKTNGTTNNANAIPYKIYGIRYERVEPPQLEDLTIIEDLGIYQIPATGTWTFPNVKPYKRMFICFPIWGTYNSTTLASTPIFADANQSSTTISNWTNRAGGVVTNTTLSAYVMAIRMEF